MRNQNDTELFRLQNMSSFENELFNQGYKKVAGVDEAGRGPLAGPVVAACCVLPRDESFFHINDSKKLSSSQREALFSKLTTHPNVLYSVSIVAAHVIDKINILQATFLAMKNAVESLKELPDFVLIDGNLLPSIQLPKKAIVKGDSLSISIAAASIIAKVTRDRIMDEYDKQYPEYGFKSHKGYGTKKHLEAIEKMGPCPIHRMTFAPIKKSEVLQEIDLMGVINDKKSQ